MSEIEDKIHAFDAQYDELPLAVQQSISNFTSVVLQVVKKAIPSVPPQHQSAALADAISHLTTLLALDSQ